MRPKRRSFLKALPTFVGSIIGGIGAFTLPEAIAGVRASDKKLDDYRNEDLKQSEIDLLLADASKDEQVASLLALSAVPLFPVSNVAGTQQTGPETIIKSIQIPLLQAGGISARAYLLYGDIVHQGVAHRMKALACGDGRVFAVNPATRAIEAAPNDHNVRDILLEELFGRHRKQAAVRKQGQPPCTLENCAEECFADCAHRAGWGLALIGTALGCAAGPFVFCIMFVASAYGLVRQQERCTNCHRECQNWNRACCAALRQGGFPVPNECRDFDAA